MIEKSVEEMFPEANQHQLPVKVKIVAEKNKIESEGFIEEVIKFLSEGRHVWRSSGKLSTYFNVDSSELHKFLLKFDKIVHKKKDDEEILYALKSRVEDKIEKFKPVITEEDRYAIGQISLANDMIEQILKRFGPTIHMKCPEAFSYLVEGKGKMDIGIVHLANATKADLEKLN